MKLLLDEQYDAAIARELRKHSRDVIAVAEDIALRTRGDPDLLAYAFSERRVIVTENVRHFGPLHATWLASGQHHAGIIFTSPKRLPRSKATVGLFVRSLEARLSTAPDRIDDSAEWLEPVP